MTRLSSGQRQMESEVEKIFKKVKFDLDTYQEFSKDMYDHFLEKSLVEPEVRKKPTYEDLNNIMWDINRQHETLRETIYGIGLVVKLLSTRISALSQTTLDSKQIDLSVPKKIQKELKLWFKEQEARRKAMRQYIG